MFFLFFILWLSIQPSAPSQPVSACQPIPVCQPVRACRPVPACLPAFPVGTLLASADDGLTWESMDGSLPRDARPLSLWADDTRIYLGMVDGVYRTQAGLPTHHWTRDRVDQRMVTTFFPGEEGPYSVNLQTGFFQYRSSIGQWVPMHDNLKDKAVLNVLETRDGLYAGCEGGLYRTRDRGKTWDLSVAGEIDRLLQSGRALLVRTNTGILRSVDGGQAWTKVLSGIDRPFNLQQVGNKLIALVGGQEFAGVRQANRVLESYDDGATWKPAYAALPSPLHTIHDLRQTGDGLIAVSDSGVFRSTDEGVTWIQVLDTQSKKFGFYKLFVTGPMIYAIFAEGC